MDNRNKVQVNICGKSLILIANESEDYIAEIVEYINKKMYEIKNVHNAASKTLLLSVNIADELFKEREKNKKLEKEIMRVKTELAKANYKLNKHAQEFKKGNKE